MDKYLLNKMSKEALVDTVSDLLEIKTMLEYSVDNYRKWYKGEQNANNYSDALKSGYSKRAQKLGELVKTICDSLNQDNDEVSDGIVIDEIVDTINEYDVFELDGAKYTNNFTKSFMSIGDKDIKHYEDNKKRDVNEGLGTYNYQDEDTRARFRKNNFYKF